MITLYTWFPEWEHSEDGHYTVECRQHQECYYVEAGYLRDDEGEMVCRQSAAVGFIVGRLKDLGDPEPAAEWQRIRDALDNDTDMELGIRLEDEGADSEALTAYERNRSMCR